MNQPTMPRGAAPVGYLSELPEVEATAVRYLRMWCEGPEHQEEVWNDLTAHLGPHEGRIAMRSLEELCSLIAERGRRPLMRHDICCKCLGGDEAAFANLVGAAGDGVEQDSLLFAALLVDGQRALCAVRLANRIASSLSQLVAQGQHETITHATYSKPMHNRLH
ncbi:MAG: hypothetical protein AAGE80_01110 [Pseudomonadota bacterium]